MEPRYHDKQHFIIVDTTGSKIEAISYGNNVHRFDTLLQQGCKYILKDVVFGPNWGDLEFRNIGHRFEVTLTRKTRVEPYTFRLQFPPCPKHLMPFHEVIRQPNKTFVDVMGIVVHMEPLEHVGNRLYREVVLMDARWHLIIVGIWSDLFCRNFQRWYKARDEKEIIIATMLRRNSTHRCLESSDHTSLDFNPRHHTWHQLATVRRIMMERQNLHFVNRYLEARWAYLASVLPHLSIWESRKIRCRVIRKCF